MERIVLIFTWNFRLSKYSIWIRSTFRDICKRYKFIKKVNIIADFLQYWSQTSHNLAIQLDQKYLPEKQLHDAAIQACNKVIFKSLKDL